MTEVCANCFHDRANHKAICNATLTCICEKYVEPEIVEWANEVEMYKFQHKSVEARVKYMLEKWPHFRNCLAHLQNSFHIFY